MLVCVQTRGGYHQWRILDATGMVEYSENIHNLPEFLVVRSHPTLQMDNGVVMLQKVGTLSAFYNVMNSSP